VLVEGLLIVGTGVVLSTGRFKLRSMFGRAAMPNRRNILDRTEFIRFKTLSVCVPLAIGITASTHDRQPIFSTSKRKSRRRVSH
jgi:hypothetical protein